MNWNEFLPSYAGGACFIGAVWSFAAGKPGVGIVLLLIAIALFAYGVWIVMGQPNLIPTAIIPTTGWW